MGYQIAEISEALNHKSSIGSLGRKGKGSVRAWQLASGKYGAYRMPHASNPLDKPAVKWHTRKRRLHHARDKSEITHVTQLSIQHYGFVRRFRDLWVN